MLGWKADPQATRRAFEDWWKRTGVLIGMWDFPAREGLPVEAVPAPAGPPEGESLYVHPELRAQWNHYWLSRSAFPHQVLPIAETDIGPGSLSLLFGCEPRFSPATVWFDPCWEGAEDVVDLPPIRFDEDNHWWKLTVRTLEASKALAEGKYLVGCPDLMENIDILAAMREPQTLMMDMIESPGWVEEKVSEITKAWFQVYERIHDLIKEPDGSSAYGAFRLWGPGKTAKLQCDASAMFSPGMFARFVQPELTRQCDWLDHSLYHLDGTQAICHLDALLSIESLDAIEWTPQSGIETGGHERWYPMYQKILEAGKSLQVVNVRGHEVEPLLNAVGTEGIYLIMEDFNIPERVLNRLS